MSYGDYESERPKGAKCQDCQVRGLKWVETEAGWRLYEGDGKTEHWLKCVSPQAARRRRRRGLEKGVFPVSVGRIEDFRACRRFYQWRHIEHHKDTPTPEMLLGRSVHRLAAALTLQEPEPKLEDLELPAEIASEWLVLTRGLRQVIANVDLDKVVQVEERGVMTWKAGETEVEFEVVPDRVDIDGDWAEVVDYKTGWDLPTEKELRRNLQLQAYAFYVVQRYPFVNQVRGTQVQGRLARSVSATWTKEELLAFGEALKRETCEMATTVDFPPNENCERCPPGLHAVALEPFRSMTLGDQTLVLPPNVSDLQVARLIKVLERVLKFYRAYLRQQTRAGAPIELEDGSGFGWFLKVDKKVKDIEAAISLVKEAGKDPNEVFSFNFSKGAKYLRGKSTVPGLAALVEESFGTEFDFRSDVGKEIDRLEEVMKIVEANQMAALEASLPGNQLQVIEGGKP